MKFEEEDILLRIYIGEHERYEHIPLFEHIILKCRELNIAGATAFKGMLGYGADKKIHSSKIVDLSDNLPVLIEITDRKENIEKLMPYLDHAISKGFVTMQKVNVIKYRN